MTDSDSDSLGEIPLCDAPAPPKKAKIEVATSNHSLESSVAKREAAERAKADAEEAKRAAAARAEAERKAAAAKKEAPVVVEDPTKPAPVKFVKSKKRSADETTRQRNKRKEGLGQAKFTLKEDRDCPSIWDGGGGR